jgi:hypothetical protein
LKRIAIIIFCFLAIPHCLANDAKKTFKNIAKQLTILVKDANANAVITQSETSFESKNAASVLAGVLLDRTWRREIVHTLHIQVWEASD